MKCNVLQYKLYIILYIQYIYIYIAVKFDTSHVFDHLYNYIYKSAHCMKPDR